jgi:hypothetical protein
MSRKDNPEQAFARQLLKLIAATGNDGMEMWELVARTGRSAEDIEDMLQRLRDAGYTRQATRPKHTKTTISADELRVLNYLYSRSPPDLTGEDDDPGLRKEDDVPAGEAGWTPDQDDGGELGKQILRALFLKGLIQDTGWRRRGEVSGRYEIAWVVTDLAVELYGEQMRHDQELLRQKILNMWRELVAVKDRPPDDATKAKFHEVDQLTEQVKRGPQFDQLLRRIADIMNSASAGMGQEWLDQIDQMALQTWHPNNSRSN